MNKMIETIKEVHSQDICLFRIGNFYHVYKMDAYIISYLFGYKIKDMNNEIKECGFPTTAIAKVMARLENKKINYMIIDRRNDYDVERREDYKNLNNYLNFSNKSKKYINSKKRIDNIYNYLIQNIEKENEKILIQNIEKVISEGRKI